MQALIEQERGKRGRPRSTTSSFALKRAATRLRKVEKERVKLSIAGCTPETPKHCRCSDSEFEFHGFTPDIVLQLRTYLTRIGKDNAPAVREFMIERVHVSTEKLSNPNKNLSNVQINTFMMEKPAILAARLARVLASERHLRLVQPAQEDMTAVCTNAFFFLCGKSKDFFYAKNPLKRSRSNHLIAEDRKVVAVRERRPQPARMETKTYYLLQWVRAEMKRHLNDPTGGLDDVVTILPYKDKLEAHAYFVIELEQNIGDWEHKQTASDLYFRPESELMALYNPDNDGDDNYLGDDNPCPECALQRCECARSVEKSSNSLAGTNKDGRYGNRYLGSKGTQPMHPDVLSYSMFTLLWKANEEFKRLKLRKWMPFAKCDVCVRNEESRNEPMSAVKRRAHVAEFAGHLEFVRRERQAYYHNIELAIADPTTYLSIILDGADASDYAMPHTKTRSHASSACNKVKMHLMGGLAHGRDTFLWTIPPQIAQGHNVTIQSLHKMLCHIIKNEGQLPGCLFLQLDNTTKQNKGKGLLAYLSVLIWLGVFKQVYVNFLPVGHTHEDIDQIFSRVSVHLRHRNAPTLAKLHTELRRSVKKYGKPPIVAHWPAVQNTSAFLEKGMTRGWTKDITLYYAFRIQIGNLPQNKGKVIVQARTYPGSPAHDSTDLWRGFQVDCGWVEPFQNTEDVPIPCFIRDNADMPKQAVPQHILDARKTTVGYAGVLNEQVLSIRRFMKTLPHIFTEAVVRENELLFEDLGKIEVDYTWPLDEIKQLYSKREELLPSVHNACEDPSILDTSLGFFNQEIPAEDEVEEKSNVAFRADCGEQNVVGFKMLEKNKYYFMGIANICTQFKIVKAVKIETAEEDASICTGAWVQYWECSTNTPEGLSPEELKQANAEKDINIVEDPWHTNAKHIRTSDWKRLEFHTIDEFIDEVSMTKWTKGKEDERLKKQSKPPFAKKLWVEPKTKLLRINMKHWRRAQNYWAGLTDRAEQAPYR